MEKEYTVREVVKYNMDFKDIRFVTSEVPNAESMFPSSMRDDARPKINYYFPDEPTRRLPFYLTVAGHFVVGKDHYTERHYREGYQCILTIAGNCQVEYKNNGQPIKCRPGSILLLDCGVPHRYYCGDAGFWEYKHFHFCTNSGKELVERILGVTNNLFFCDELFNRIFDLIGNYRMINAFMISDLISHLMTEILCFKYSNELEEGHCMLLERVAEYLRNHYAEDVSIADIAKNESISKYYLIKLFRSYFGTTPYAYLVNYRVAHAKTLLLTDTSINAVAQQCGFGNTNNFNRIFKRTTGTTPSEYKKKHISV